MMESTDATGQYHDCEQQHVGPDCVGEVASRNMESSKPEEELSVYDDVILQRIDAGSDAAPPESRACTIWECLPDIVIGNIYKHLKDNDRATMSYVCGRWSRLFHLPELWRERAINFHCRCHLRKENKKRIVGFAKAHGAYLRRLEIQVMSDYPKSDLKQVLVTLKRLFLILQARNTQLEELRILHLWLEQRNWHTNAVFRERFIESLSKFLRHQKAIRVLDLSGAWLGTANGLRVLENMSRGCGAILEDLKMEDYFLDEWTTIPGFGNILPRLPNLKRLELNHNCITNQALRVLATQQTRHLKLLKIHIGDSLDLESEGVDPISWKHLHQACPKLRVHMRFCATTWQDFKRAASCYVPLYSLEVMACIREQSQMAENLFRLTADSWAETLEFFSVRLNYDEVEPEEAGFGEGLLYFLNRCRRIKTLKIEIHKLPTGCDQCLLHCHLSQVHPGDDVIEEIKRVYPNMLNEKNLVQFSRTKMD